MYPKELVVGARSTDHSHLVYAPRWICSNATATLVLSNQATAEKYVYELNCTAKEPLARDHIVLECQAKSSVLHELVLENPHFARKCGVTYQIESDLPGISGDSELSMDGNTKSMAYALTIKPQCGNLHAQVAAIVWPENGPGSTPLYLPYSRNG